MNVHSVNNHEEALIWFNLRIDEYLQKEFDDDINESVKHFVQKYWKEIADLPASSTGRYHHKTENLKPYGLLNHTLRVVYLTKELGIEEIGYPAGYDKWKNNRSIKMAIAAAFLHDFGKVEDFGAQHGKETVRMLTEVEGKHPLPPEVLSMCKHHMHNWSFIHCVEVWDRIVAYADYLASRPSIHLSEVTYLVKEGQQHVLGTPATRP